MNNISAIILSKDRACQLHLLLSSIKVNASKLFENILVLVKSSSDNYTQSYKELEDEIQGLFFCTDTVVQFIDEKEFYPDFLHLIKCLNNENHLICGLTDDMCFHSEAENKQEEIIRAFTDDVFCFSLRLGYNTIVQNYLDGSLQRPLNAEHAGENIIKWNWKNRHPMENYGYPISLDGHIYRSEELLNLSTIKSFHNLREWEGYLAQHIRSIIDRPYMIASPSSSVVSIANNCVQYPPMIAGALYPSTPEELNQRFLDGYRIDLAPIMLKRFSSSHIELPFSFIKNE